MRRNAVTNNTRFLLACGAIASLGFIAVFLIAGALRADYRPMYHPVSALSLGDGGWVQIANFIITGALVFAGAVGLRRGLLDGPGTIWGPRLVGLFGLCLIASGIFVIDPTLGYPPTAAPVITCQGVIHYQVGRVAFLALPLACFVFAYRFSRESVVNILASYCVLSGVLVIAFSAWGQYISANGGPGGLYQRLSIIIGWCWVAVLMLLTRRRLSTATAR